MFGWVRQNLAAVSLVAIGLGLAVVIWATLFGGFWERQASGSYGNYTLRAGLLQAWQCYGAAPCEIHQAEAMPEAGGMFKGFKMGLLTSLGVIVLGFASWLTKILQPDSHFPIPTPMRTLVLFAEISGLTFALPLFLPEAWHLAGGYGVFVLGLLLVILGSGTLTVILPSSD